MFQENARITTIEPPILRFQMSKKYDSQYAIRSVGELMQVLIAVNHCMIDSSTLSSSIYSSKRELRPYLFNHMV
jgi:hypothetical protein